MAKRIANAVLSKGLNGIHNLQRNTADYKELVNQGDHFFKSNEFYEIQKEWEFENEKDKEPKKDVEKKVGTGAVEDGDESQRSQTKAERQAEFVKRMSMF